MEQYVIKGGNPLVGEVDIAGAKNAALAILSAAIPLLFPYANSFLKLFLSVVCPYRSKRRGGKTRHVWVYLYFFYFCAPCGYVIIFKRLKTVSGGAK